MPAQKRKHRKVCGDAKAVLRFFLLFAFLMLLFGGIIRLAASWQNRIWVGGSRITFIAAASPATVFSYQDSRELVSISFGKNVQVQTAGGLGDWNIESLYELGKQKGVGGGILVKSMQYSLGVPIDGYFSGKFTPGFPGVLEVFQEDSSFTFFDKVKIAFIFSRITPSQHKNLSAEKLGIITKKRLGDGTLGFGLVPEKVKDVVTRELGDANLAKEKTGVGIVNGANVSRAGEQIAQIAKAMGSQILWVRTEKEINERCILKVEKVTETASRLARIFSCEIVTAGNLPAPIVFVIGLELAKELP